MTADLRRLAEQATDAFTVDGLPGVSVPAQAILALLDERDWARSERDATVTLNLELERRVAALEAGLRRYGWHITDPEPCPATLTDSPGSCTCGYDEARALLDPAAVMGSAANAAEGTGIGPFAILDEEAAR